MADDLLKKIIAHAKEYGFIFPSSEIYEGLGAVYDYGQNGAELKNNIKEYWWRSMVQLHSSIVGIDSAIFMHPRTWEASGHLKAFNDPLIDNKDSKKRYRADVLIEEYRAKLQTKIEKEIKKGRKKFADNFDEQKFRATNPNVLRNQKKIDKLNKRFKKALNDNDLKELRQIIIDVGIADPISGSKNWTEVRQFNLMFSTQLGSLSDTANKIFLRPETAQGIFVNFLNVMKSGRMKVPFGIAQTGKAFRNEIVARQFVFRMREFEQMEMQFFIRPGQEEKWFDYWKNFRVKWHKNLNLNNENLKITEHEKLAHYAEAAVDIEFKFPMGFKEVEGIHSRTNYDLSKHQEFSGKKMQYYDPELKKSYIPYVVETSIGLDRMFMTILADAYKEETVAQTGEKRIVLTIPPALAPVKIAILPLIKKDGLPQIAEKIFDKLKLHFNTIYEEKDSIGKRYRRQDAIGTPYCITIDHQTKDDNTVTLRHRDSMKQERISIENLIKVAEEKVSLTKLLEKLT